MIEKPLDLFQAFKEDHAILGLGFYEIAGHLRERNLSAAKKRADRVDREAGAHVAFEEKFFYPALRRFLDNADVDRLKREHDEGLAVIKQLAAASSNTIIAGPEREDLLRKSENMEKHVAECGELFGTMGRFSLEEQDTLLRQLVKLRQDAPRWTEFASGMYGSSEHEG